MLNIRTTPIAHSNLIEFLKRVPLNGAEVDAFIEVMQDIQNAKDDKEIKNNEKISEKLAD